ncbi:hypothetical protein M0R19_01270 [Candidatus Pacearchaeota archaeon]|jgi:hypothetical protein|nr:hypothetical protein [Candidatus Pacearchaeota archaeon]
MEKNYSDNKKYSLPERVAHELAGLYLKDSLKKGKTIEIPSLGIIIKPEDCGYNLKE